MAKWDTIYCELCEKIITDGKRVENRTGIDTIKVPSAHFQLDVGKEFPILTTKQLFIRQAVLEMLWIYQHSRTMFAGCRKEMMQIWGFMGDQRERGTGVMKRPVPC